MKPLVSVIVPVYNVEKYLHECINSILAQSLSEIQIICVDDGSTDTSGKILDEYEKNHSNIEVIHKTNSGYGHTMNVGIAAAKAEYIGIVESDDYIRTDMYELLYNRAKENDLDIVKSGYMEHFTKSANEAVLLKTKNKPSNFNYNVTGVLSPLLKDDIVMSAIWCGLYKTSFLKAHNIVFNETAGASYQDIGFSALTQVYSKKTMYIDDYLYRYRIDNPQSSVKSKDKVYNVFKEFEYIFTKIKGTHLYDEYSKVLIKEYLTQIASYNLTRIDNAFIADYLKYAHKTLTENWQEYRSISEALPLPHKQLIELIVSDEHKATSLIIAAKNKLQENIEKLYRCDEFIIYGAGIVGVACYKKLIDLKLFGKVICFVTTEALQKKPIGNVYVEAIDDIDNKNASIIVAVSEAKTPKAAQEMYHYAKKIGFKNVICYSDIGNLKISL